MIKTDEGTSPVAHLELSGEYCRRSGQFSSGRFGSDVTIRVTKLQPKTRTETLSYLSLDFPFCPQKSNHRLLYPITEPPVIDSVEAKITAPHLGHHTQDQIVALLRTGKPRLPRCHGEFHRFGVILGL
jgi:hypothetical protein